MIRLRIYIFLLFLIVISILVYIIHNFYISDINAHLENKTKDLNTAYQKVVQTYSIPARAIFDIEINRPDILKIISKANKGSDQEKDKLRSKLYDLLSPAYGNMIKYGYKQLHFHLPDNTSFLRFHKPEKYGDDLTDVRSTVKHTNEHREFTYGFEEGVSISSFRYVFPLSYSADHIGSVELSVSYFGIISKIEENRDIACSFMVSKETIEDNVLEEEKDNYLICHANKNYFVIKEGHDIIIKKTVNNETYPTVFQNFYKQENAKKIFESNTSGTAYTNVNGKDFTVTLLSISNFNNFPVAYITAVEYDSFKKEIISSYIVYGLFIITITAIGFLLAILIILKNVQLRKANTTIKVLDGLLPICSHCKKIRNDEGTWDQLESYINKRSEAKFSHSVCPECAEKYYGKIID